MTLKRKRLKEIWRDVNGLQRNYARLPLLQSAFRGRSLSSLSLADCIRLI
ncbi:hypothetical protein [Ensifer canadensis]